MVRRKAAWASEVIESASSKIISLYGGPLDPFPTDIWAKFLTLVLMISIPRSADAFNSSTLDVYTSGLIIESLKHKLINGSNFQLTHKSPWPKPESLMFCQYLGVHRIINEEARIFIRYDYL